MNKTELDKNMLKKCSEIIEQLRNTCPLTHCITNYVTINDCANAVLAIGGSPSMANEAPEIKEFVEIAGATVINMGTLLEDQIEPMKIAATHTKKTGTPLVLDPVAVGVTQLRNDVTVDLIEQSSVSVIRGNMSEIKAIAKLFNIITESVMAKGVDVADSDVIGEDNIQENASIVKNIAKKLDTVIAVSGPVDIISDGKVVYIIDNGDAVMSKITGSGCMLTCVIGSFTAVTNPLEAALIGSLSMAIAGEKAKDKMELNDEGSGSFRTYLIDELYKMNKNSIIEYGKLYKLKEEN
ncbi:hydroxyethylthiazole kinase [Methanosphaera sp. WGK6]|uniref:hydroxyethylthiazole kinase n=1 Tax=Methanosphaera sp. WGK6 TaxID=1561964 RepID=UPI000AF1DA19|nr:hydroxyethylthiazole kinase [Methanosphaera sp. WGK6]